MSFSRVNPGGWATGAILTSTQQNQLDIDHANSVDKTVAGDTISGLLGLTSTAAIVAGISSGAQGMSGAVTGGSVGLGYAPGTTTPLISTGVAYGIMSAVPAGIALGGGATDFPTFVGISSGAAPAPIARSRVVVATAAALGTLPTGWTVLTFTGIKNTSGSQGDSLPILMPLHNGATLSQVSVFFAVGVSHHPVTMPGMSVNRVPLVNGVGSTPTSIALSSTAVQNFPDPGSGSAYYASGNLQQMNYACNQNNVIDTTQYGYYVRLIDEAGSGFANGNVYYGVACTYGSIADMRFQ